MPVDPYEVAVYLDDAADLATELLAVIAHRTPEITDARVRSALIAAALGTVAQMVDQVEDGRFKEGGATQLLQAVVARWTR